MDTRDPEKKSEPVPETPAIAAAQPAPGPAPEGPPFTATRARYESGIGWRHFEVEVGKEVATFRFHMDESVCWSVNEKLEELGDRYLPMHVDDGEQHLCVRFDGISGGAMSGDGWDMPDPVPARWAWLEAAIASAPKRRCCRRRSGSWCKYYGVRLHAGDEAK